MRARSWKLRRKLIGELFFGDVRRQISLNKRWVGPIILLIIAMTFAGIAQVNSNRMKFYKGLCIQHERTITDLNVEIMELQERLHVVERDNHFLDIMVAFEYPNMTSNWVD